MNIQFPVPVLLLLLIVFVVASAQAEDNNADPVQPITTTHYFNQTTVTAAFAAGRPLYETPEYKVHASRRTEPGLVEIHQHETDVVYVLEGSATLVTGGHLLDGAATAPGEIRGRRLEGGTEQQLGPGDVVVVPRGTPHWFRDVHQVPFLYFVVKPIDHTGGAS